MDDSGVQKEDIKIPENDIGKEIRSRFEKDEQFLVTILVREGLFRVAHTKSPFVFTCHSKLTHKRYVI